MRSRRTRKLCASAVVSLFALAGCAEATDEGVGNRSSKTDAGADIGAATDVGSDVGSDVVGSDAGTDAGSDDGTDTAMDDAATADSGVDADSDASEPTDASDGETSPPVGAVLVYDDSAESLAPAAVTAMGGTPTLTETDSAFAAAFDAGGFSAIVIDAPYETLPSGIESRLSTWVAGGGRLVFAYWDLDGSPTLQTLLGVSTSDYFTPKSVYADPASPVDVFSFKQVLPSPLAGAVDEVDDDGDDLTLTGAGFLAARLGSAAGPGGIAVVAGGRVIVNGFTPYNFRSVDADSDGSPDMRELWENELAYVLSK